VYLVHNALFGFALRPKKEKRTKAEKRKKKKKKNFYFS